MGLENLMGIPYLSLIAEYEDFVEGTMSDRVPPDERLTWAMLGLVAEVGELCEVKEKALRKRGSIMGEDFVHFDDELGDILWYLVAITIVRETTLERVITNNMRKLRERLAAKAKEVKGGSV